MKKIFLTLIAIASIVACKNEKKNKVVVEDSKTVEVIEDLDNVDIEESTIYWKGEKPTGTHAGTVKLESGSLVLKDGELSAGTFLIDMASIKSSEDLEKLDKHLKSADFFDVSAYPKSKFVITSVNKVDGKYEVTGNLNIKDVSKSITIPAMIDIDENTITLKSDTFVINRADFNVKYASKSFFDNLKDKFINDDMEMSFVIKATK